ncbi:MAG: DUF1570 domain-containing protein [Planctomycetes bacterium]|nr:DUF1570 domain-containing protein [Planctomycetota bacterium]
MSAIGAVIVAAWILLQPACPAHAAGTGPTAYEAPAARSPLRLEGGALTGLPAELEPYATAHYVIAADDDRLWATFTGDLLERFRLRFMQAFREGGFEVGDQGEPLVWLGFHDGQDYREHAHRSDRLDVSAMSAYYSCRTNQVAILLTDAGSEPAPQPAQVVQASVGHADVAPPPSSRTGGVEVERIRHEAAHQLAYSLGLMKRGVMYPFWLAEGLATSFETCGEDTTLLTADNPVRRADLLCALQNGRLAPLEEFVVMAHLPSGDRQTAVDVYGQSWGFWQFLLRTRPAPLRRYMRSLAHLPMGRRRPQQLRGEFIEAFGPIQRVEADWQRYLQDLSATLADGSDGP